MVKVKICGIRDARTAAVVVAAGADFLGFNFVPTSKRRIDVGVAQGIIEEIRGAVTIVGVFADAPVDLVNDTALALGLDFVQLHGGEGVDYLRMMKVPVIKAVRVNGRLPGQVLAEMKELRAEYFLLDRDAQGEGEMVNQAVATAIAREFPVFMAGGLATENVGAMVRAAQPFAVDVAGGIETAGRIDAEKIRAFVAAAKGI